MTERPRTQTIAQNLAVSSGLSLIVLSLIADEVGLSSDPTTFGTSQYLVLSLGIVALAYGFAGKIGWLHIFPDAVINLHLLAGSVGLVMLTMELIVFPRVLTFIPLRMHMFVPESIRVLAQSSKFSSIPRDYIMIIGDS